MPDPPPCTGREISADNLKILIDRYQTKKLPSSHQVFPWLHGIATAQCIQTAYFRAKSPRSSPPCLPQLLLLVKVGDPKNVHGQLFSSVRPRDVLKSSNCVLQPEFLDPDPEQGVNLRNLDMQVAKCVRGATIVLYSFGDDLEGTYKLFEGALSKCPNANATLHTLAGSPQELPDLLTKLDPVSYDPLSPQQYTHWDLNFAHYSNLEVLHMSKATKVMLGTVPVWIGNNMDANLGKWETLVECVADASMPSISACDHNIRSAHNDMLSSIIFEFPASESINPAVLSANDVVLMLNVCKAVHARSRNYLTLAVSPEGYRGNTLFAILFGIFCTGKPIATVIPLLYRSYERPLLCSDGDVEIIRTLEALFMDFSPTKTPNEGAISLSKVAAAFGRLTAQMYSPPTDEFSSFNGSLPSRIMGHLFLGALVHATNPAFLAALGITRILSVGEQLPWLDYSSGKTLYNNPCEGIEQVLYLPRIVDDGIDSLLPVLGRSLEFLEKSRRDGAKTLVHCRVGVSRSAAICIAEVMHLTEWSLPQAYLYVRVRRLNLVIQPNLRFLYELMQFEEQLSEARGCTRLRCMEWPLFCREIARLNA